VHVARRHARQVVHTLITELFEGVVYDLLVPCVDCVRAVAAEPHMFSAKQVKRAQQLNAPFLQCTKSFHIVGLGALNEMVPPTTADDYSEHLQVRRWQSTRDARVADDAARARRAARTHDHGRHAPVLGDGRRVERRHSADLPQDHGRTQQGKGALNEMTFKQKVCSQITYETFALSRTNSTELGGKLCACACVLVYVTDALCSMADASRLVAYIGDKTYKPLVTVLGNGIAGAWRTTAVGMLLTQDIYLDMKDETRCEDKMPVLVARLAGMRVGGQS